MVGIGLLFTALGLRAGLMDFPVTVTGLVMSAYFVGFMLGTYLCPAIIRRAGHIRAFAAMASVASTMPILHALLVNPWAWGLLRDTGRVLLDREMDHGVVEEVKDAVARSGDADTRIADLHLWRVGKARYACILSLVTHDPALTPERVKTWLARHGELAHVTVEIHQCSGTDAKPSAC